MVIGAVRIGCGGGWRRRPAARGLQIKLERGAFLVLAVARWRFSARWPAFVHSVAVAAVIISVVCGVTDQYSTFELGQVR